LCRGAGRSAGAACQHARRRAHNPPPCCHAQAPVIPRGDLQTTFGFKGFEEVRRLGLSQATEALVRSAPVRSHGSGQDAASVGMLVVESVVPGSPADKVLEPGDVLVQVRLSAARRRPCLPRLPACLVEDCGAGAAPRGLPLSSPGVPAPPPARLPTHPTPPHPPCRSTALW
jgi:hypothetical protein